MVFCIVENLQIMRDELIAPCGMNCALCISYLFKEKDLNKLGFHKTYCPGCLPRGENCTHLGDRCEKLAQGKVRFCYECSGYPCGMLKSLDKRYRTKYHMSMIENLESIRQNGIEAFLDKEHQKWGCPDCGGTICCHNGLCLTCHVDTLKHNKKYCWEEDNQNGNDK